MRSCLQTSSTATSADPSIFRQKTPVERESTVLFSWVTVYFWPWNRSWPKKKISHQGQRTPMFKHKKWMKALFFKMTWTRNRTNHQDKLWRFLVILFKCSCSCEIQLKVNIHWSSGDRILNSIQMPLLFFVCWCINKPFLAIITLSVGGISVSFHCSLLAP